MSPAQFQKVLGWLSQDPSRLTHAVQGGGDVPYLDQRQATQVADQAAIASRGLLSFLMSQNAASGATPAPTALPVAPPTPPPPVSTRMAPGGGGVGSTEAILQPVAP